VVVVSNSRGGAHQTLAASSRIFAKLNFILIFS
jgi:hypothetical protein